MQTLKPQDHKTCLEFACRFWERMEADDAGRWKILWYDEAHFYLDGAGNSQNYRIWSTSPPNVLHQKPLHSDCVTTCVKLLLSSSSDIFFFETITLQDPKRQSVTIALVKTFNDLQQQVIPALQERQSLQTTNFMQDGATLHIER
ncbi:transposable element tc3 transposase [Trichonephila clavipes]|nr:transposable element tc3 transposase [Trichonephila clavipes]